MIEAQKNSLATNALNRYQAHHMRRVFSTVKIRYHAEVPGSHDIPTIYYANHSSKWDHHIGGYITEKLWQQDSYYMVALQMMTVYPVLKYVGSFSVHQSNPLEAAKAMDYCSDLLSAAPNRAVWVFPQGGIHPNHKRPLEFQQGTAQLIRLMDRVRVVPVTFHYDFLYCSKPELFINFGTPQLFERPVKTTTRKLTAQLEEILTADLDQLAADIAAERYNTFKIISQGKGIFLNRVYTRYQFYKYLVRKKLGLIPDEAEPSAESVMTEAADSASPLLSKTL